MEMGKGKKFDDPLLPENWDSIRLSKISNKMSAWCKEQQLEYGRDYGLHTQNEEVVIVVGEEADGPMEFKATLPFHYFFFKNPVNATAFRLMFYETYDTRV